MNTKLIPERKAEILAALRSGEYEQGTNALRPTTDTWCCLGVMTDRAVKAGVGEWHEGTYYGRRGDNEDIALPASVSKWLTGDPLYALRVPVNQEIHERFPADWLVGDLIDLAFLNDNGYTFAEIADLIEEHL